jgi:hypothetical protein
MAVHRLPEIDLGTKYSGGGECGLQIESTSGSVSPACITSDVADGAAACLFAELNMAGAARRFGRDRIDPG